MFKQSSFLFVPSLKKTKNLNLQMQESVLYRKDRKYNLYYIQVQIGIFFK